MTKLTIDEIVRVKVDTCLVKKVLDALSSCNYKKELLSIKDNISELRNSETAVEVIDELIETNPVILKNLEMFAKDIFVDKTGCRPVMEFEHYYKMLDKLYSFCRVAKLYKTGNLFMLAMQIIDTNRQYERLLTTAREMNLLAVEKEVDEW